MTDWTTCRVVRDRDGDLWFRGCDSDDLWTANTNWPDIFLTADEVLTVFGPLTPVLVDQSSQPLPPDRREPSMNRDAETVPARHETPDVAELRRLAEAATPGPWSTAAFQLVIDVARRIDVGMCGHRDDAAFIAAANPATVLALLDERDALAAKVERVRALHRAFGIYDECDCDAPDPATHLDVDDVGLTCNLMYRVCAECCRDDVYQTEGCASYHAHRLDEDYHCPTISALDEEPQP